MKALLISFVIASTVGIASCTLFDGAKSRLQTEDVILDLRAIRNAEMDHRQLFGTYASIEDLVKNGVLDSRFNDLNESGFSFELQANKDHYQLAAVPEDYEEQLSTNPTNIATYFLDDSSLIRANFDPKQKAGVQSETIRPKSLYLGLNP
jgi:hypothetical protein